MGGRTEDGIEVRLEVVGEDLGNPGEKPLQNYTA